MDISIDVLGTRRTVESLVDRLVKVSRNGEQVPVLYARDSLYDPSSSRILFVYSGYGDFSLNHVVGSSSDIVHTHIDFDTAATFTIRALKPKRRLLGHADMAIDFLYQGDRRSLKKTIRKINLPSSAKIKTKRSLEGLAIQDYSARRMMVGEEAAEAMRDYLEHIRLQAVVPEKHLRPIC